MLHVNPEYMCVDGTQTKKVHRQLDPYREHICELLGLGFKTTQILAKLRELFPDIQVKRTTLSDYCIKLRAEIFDYMRSPSESCAPQLSKESILAPYAGKISTMLADNKRITVIFAAIKADGYTGSYSLLQQYCLSIKPITYMVKKTIKKVRRKVLVTEVWSGKSGLSQADLSHIYDNYPVLNEIKVVISEFRKAYSKKDISAVKAWCVKYAQCRFPAFCSFINGIHSDSDAFYNSMMFEWSNGLLEGCVNKLKAVKRSMFGRASYSLLKAKLLLTNDT